MGRKRMGIPNLIDSTLDIAAFVATFYELIGGKLRTIGPALEVYLDDNTAKKLDGPWAREQTLLFVFKDEDLLNNTGAELVTMGSYRLHYIIQQLLSRGQFTQVAISPDAIDKSKVITAQRYYKLGSNLIYQPYLAITFSIVFQGNRRWEELHSVCINRVTGSVSSFNWKQLLPYLQKFSAKEAALLEKAQCSLKHSYQALEKEIIMQVAACDQSWSKEALGRLAKEQSDLVDFFDQLTTEEGWKNPEAIAEIKQSKALRLKEQEERFAPRVLIRPWQIALITVPVQITSYLQVRGKTETKVELISTPFSNQLR